MRSSKTKLILLAALPIAVLAGVQGGGVAPIAVRAFDLATAPQIQRHLLSGWASMELTRGATATRNASIGSFRSTSDDGCSRNRGSNVKVNQNCLNITDPILEGRAQAQNETSIAVDPLRPNHVVASFNDYRRGDGNCYGAYSNNGGDSWADTTIPMGFTLGTKFGGVPRQYWHAGGDTSVAWDTKGNAYLSCQVFMRGQPVSNNPDQSSALYVFRSTGNNGASWNFPARPVAESASITGSGAFLDKQLLTVDNHIGSPFQDRLYVTWTLFDTDGTAYIFEAHSNNYGESFSSPVVVSKTSSLCGNTFGFPTPHGKCNENQFSQPFTGPDGNLYVTWANFNNVVSGSDNRNQMLLARSTDGGVSFSAPTKVGDYYDLPDCATYQNGADAGRACVPEKNSTTLSIFRAASYPSGAVNPTNPRQIVVNYSSYINRDSNHANGCVPSGFSSFGGNLYTGVKTPGACNNKILLSVSNDGGGTFTGGAQDPPTMATVNPDARQKTTDQWWQWTAFTQSGKLAVSYYDRQYGADETLGNSDLTVSGTTNLVDVNTVRVTTSSMPPETEFTGLFFGDYTGLAVAGQNALPLWSDTRDQNLFLCPGTGAPGVPPAVCTGTESGGPQAGLQSNDENIYTAMVPIP
jgi:hypothetical protein